MLRPGGDAAQLQEATDLRDLVIVFEGVAALLRNWEGHLMSVQDHLEVFLLGLIAGATELLKHVHDVAPMNVVRCGMREDLADGLFSVVAHE